MSISSRSTRDLKEVMNLAYRFSLLSPVSLESGQTNQDACREDCGRHGRQEEPSERRNPTTYIMQN